MNPEIFTGRAIQRYLAEHAKLNLDEDGLPPPVSALKLSVVIPSLAEHARLPAVLDSLEQGSQRLAEAEVVVLVNNPASAPSEILADNLQTLQDLQNHRSSLRVFGLDRCASGRALPDKQAGVGLARRLGMDAALRRLQAAGNSLQAAVACLDADSPVAPGYIDALLAVFDRKDPPLAGLCAYAHPIPKDPQMAAAIIAYELWLRYFVAGMKLAGSLFAFPAIGSCMAVSAQAYALAGGMEPRRAGEDFHFLRKLAKLSGWDPLASLPTRVYPTARVSDRVPFGTGKAMETCLTHGMQAYLEVTPPTVFFELRRFFAAAQEGFKDIQNLRRALSPKLADFLEAENAWPILERFRKTYPSSRHFALAVQHWFDSLRIVRFANLRRRSTGGVWMFDAWAEVLAGLNQFDLVSDLPRPGRGNQDLDLHLQWLDRLRKK